MKKVLGLGGVFFTADDPTKLKRWYRKHLGLNTDDYGTNFVWRHGPKGERKGFTQWTPFEKGAEHFEPSEKQFMINYRVHDLEALIEQLADEGVEILGPVSTVEYGKFAHIMDLEGNKVELWEPNDTQYEKMCEGVTG